MMTQRPRRAGFLVSLGLLVFVGALVAHIVGTATDSPPEGATREEVAAHLAFQPQLHMVTQYIQAAGLLVAALGALLLVPQATMRPLPGNVGWMAAGIGALMLGVTLLVRGAALTPLAADYEAETALFVTFSRGVSAMFGMFALTMMTGFMLAIGSEAFAVDTWRRVAIGIGVAGLAIAATEPLGALLGVDLAGPWLGPAVLIGMLVTIWTAAAIAWAGRRVAPDG